MGLVVRGVLQITCCY